jgi:hypothetical protein
MSSIARLTEWRERALAGAATALKERGRDDRDDKIVRLKSKVGEITMDNEPLYAKVEALEGKRPLAHDLARQRLSLSQGDAPNTIARRPGPVGACSDAELAGADSGFAAGA